MERRWWGSHRGTATWWLAGFFSFWVRNNLGCNQQGPVKNRLLRSVHLQNISDIPSQFPNACWSHSINVHLLPVYNKIQEKKTNPINEGVHVAPNFHQRIFFGWERQGLGVREAPHLYWRPTRRPPTLLPTVSCFYTGWRPSLSQPGKGRRSRNSWVTGLPKISISRTPHRLSEALPKSPSSLFQSPQRTLCHEEL